MTRLDFLLLLMILIWGTNFSVVKVALRDFPEIPFNAMRLVVATDGVPRRHLADARCGASRARR